MAIIKLIAFINQKYLRLHYITDKYIRLKSSQVSNIKFADSIIYNYESLNYPRTQINGHWEKMCDDDALSSNIVLAERAVPLNTRIIHVLLVKCRVWNIIAN